MAKPTFKNNVRRFLAMPVVRVLASLGVTPNMVTIAGLAVVLGAGYLVSQGWLLAGGLILLFSGAFDAVLIDSPNKTHGALVQAAAAAGKHVLVHLYCDVALPSGRPGTGGR